MTALVHEFVRSSPAYDGLCFEEQVLLADWLSRTLHVDAVIDFSDRPWNIDGAGPVFGVFRKCNENASWLIVRSGTEWGLASCDDGSVSQASMSLTDVLASIEAAM
ncbi:MAG TPA: hypothetical protein DDZ81_12255 [Acetobacteraceae bacterium]|jgi:hypothetical protein|nr:hypothetical protein [Acetobacteraceae bacterium]